MTKKRNLTKLDLGFNKISEMGEIFSRKDQ